MHPNTELNIVLLNDHLGVGGVERATVQLANAFAGAGHRVSLCLMLRHHRAMQDQLAANVAVEDMGLLGFKQPLATVRAVWALANYLRHGQFDAMIITKPPTVCMALFARFMLRKKPLAIAVLHEDVRRVVAAQTGFKKAVFTALYRFIYPRASRVVAVSAASAQSMAACCAMPISNIAVIANAVVVPPSKDDNAAAHPWLAANAAPVFIAVGRLTPEKNIGLLLEAFAQAQQQTPCKLLILGDGAQRASLEQLAARLGVATQVDFVGEVQDPYAYMRRARALVLSSDHEALPTVIIEAHACACPVIATQCNASVAELLADGALGTLVPMRDAKSLAQALAQHAQERIVPDTKAIDALLARYTPNSILQAYMALYDDAVRIKKMAVVMDSLAGGGAESVAVKLAVGLRLQGIAVDMVLTGNNAQLADQLHGVPMVMLRSQRPWIGTPLTFVRLLHYFYRARPDAIISGIENLHDVVTMARACYFPRVSYLGIIHTTLSAHWAHAPNWRAKLKRALALYTMRHMPLVAVSEDVAADAQHLIGATREDISCIYNPVISAQLMARVAEHMPHKRANAVPLIVCVGGLKPMKRFDLAIAAFARVLRSTSCSLRIVGEGDERASLERQIAALGIAQHVQMHGYDPDPYASLLQADAFLLSSDYEGLPSVLIEALACGCAVVATDCPSGPREILAGGIYGELVEVGNVDAMAAALLRAIQTPVSSEQRAAWIARGNQFSTERAVQAYLDYLTEQHL